MLTDALLSPRLKTYLTGLVDIVDGGLLTNEFELQDTGRILCIHHCTTRQNLRAKDQPSGMCEWDSSNTALP